MTAPLLLDNLAAYSVQLAMLVAIVGAGLWPARGLSARWQLRVWQLTLLVAAALPVLAFRPGWSGALPSNRAVRLVTVASDVGLAATSDWAWWLAALWLAGAAISLGRLVVGSLRIAQWHRRAAPWPRGRSLADGLDVRVSEHVAGPVTVGTWHPVVLVPPRLLDQPVVVQDAVLQHEALHVRRGDPAQVLATAIWRACLWFHPAARVLASRLELAREMVLDRETLARTGDRRAYAQALLAFGGSPPAPGVAAFVHRRHLSRRITALTQEEDPMSPTRRVLVLAVVVVASATVTAAGVAYAPMPGVAPAAQEPLRPGSGVQLPRVLHEVKPEYTPEALHAKIQGAVWLDIVVEADGSVGTVDVTQSLDAEYGLDDAAVDAAKQWRFEPGRKDGAAVPVQVTLEMRFTLK